MNATESIARFIANTTYEDIPRPVLDATRTIILDGVANILAGSRAAGARAHPALRRAPGRAPRVHGGRRVLPHQPAVRGFRQRRGHARSRLRAPGHSFHSRHFHAAAGHTRARRGERRFGARRRDSVRRGMGGSAAYRHGGAQRGVASFPSSRHLRPARVRLGLRETPRPAGGQGANGSGHCRVADRRRSSPTTGP